MVNKINYWKIIWKYNLRYGILIIICIYIFIYLGWKFGMSNIKRLVVLGSDILDFIVLIFKMFIMLVFFCIVIK